MSAVISSVLLLPCGYLHDMHNMPSHRMSVECAYVFIDFDKKHSMPICIHLYFKSIAIDRK